MRCTIRHSLVINFAQIVIFHNVELLSNVIVLSSYINIIIYYNVEVFEIVATISNRIYEGRFEGHGSVQEKKRDRERKTLSREPCPKMIYHRMYNILFIVTVS